MDYKEKVIALLNSQELSKEQKEKLENIFPELKESEDEKIRKAILQFFELQDDNTTYCLVPKKDILAWLEKQGKQTQLDYEHADIPQKDFAPIEPKFKVGDWVVNNVCFPMQIASIKDGMYVFTEGDAMSVLFIDGNYHLWSIQDAEDGDLIYVSTEIKGIQAIFHKFENGIIYFHCNLCSDFTQGGYEPSGDVEFVSPLQKTHYQRFFQKMKEAGYEWDANKKELKKLRLRHSMPIR